MTYNLDNTLDDISVATRPDLSFGYTYDANKNVTAESSVGTLMSPYAMTAGFDTKDRLDDFDRTNGDSQDWTLSLESDWNATTGSIDGSAINETRTHNDVHEITAVNAGSLQHDAKASSTAPR